jgi:hypothetical protein
MIADSLFCNEYNTHTKRKDDIEDMLLSNDVIEQDEAD